MGVQGLLWAGGSTACSWRPVALHEQLVMPDAPTPSFPSGHVRAAPTSFLFSEMKQKAEKPKMNLFGGRNPNAEMRGQVHYPDQMGSLVGGADDELKGGVVYGYKQMGGPKEPEETLEVEDDATTATASAGAKKKRKQKVCDPLARIRGATDGKWCKGDDACVTAVPLDFGQKTWAPFCPGGDCTALAGHPWCVSPKLIDIYDGPIEINCAASAPGSMRVGSPTGCWWLMKVAKGDELQRLPGTIIWKDAPEEGAGYLKKYGRGLTMQQAETWAQTGTLVPPLHAPGTKSVEEHADEVKARMDAEESAAPGSLPAERETLPEPYEVEPAVPAKNPRRLLNQPTKSGKLHPGPNPAAKRPDSDKQTIQETMKSGESQAGEVGIKGEEEAMPPLLGIVAPHLLRKKAQDKRSKKSTLEAFLFMPGELW